jgi:hypothetical protein
MGEGNLDVLQNLEFAAVEVWRRRPEITDHVVLRAYEAAHQQYRAEARGQTPRPCQLAGLDREVFDAVAEMCEFRLGRKALAGGPDEPVPPIPVSKLVECLRELCKSVERHTKLGGRQGYLSFIDGFLP